MSDLEYQVTGYPVYFHSSQPDGNWLNRIGRQPDIRSNQQQAHQQEACPQNFVHHTELQRVVKEINSHKLCVTTEKERNGKNKRRLKQYRCTRSGCNGKTSFYCPACIPDRKRDVAWICNKCAPAHKSKNTQ